VRRHRSNHLPAKLVMAEKAAQVVEADDLLEQVGDLQRRALAILDKAEEVGELRTAPLGHQGDTRQPRAFGEAPRRTRRAARGEPQRLPRVARIARRDSHRPGAPPGGVGGRRGALEGADGGYLAGDLRLALDRVSFASRSDWTPTPGRSGSCAPPRRGCSSTARASRARATMSGVIALHRALYFPGSLVLCLAPSERQSKELFARSPTPTAAARAPRRRRRTASWACAYPNGSR
jgi:hypothetical protein